jgi:hypothetical protein
MAGITLAQAQAKLTAYLAAEEAALLGQSYVMPGGTRVDKADLKAIREGMAYWDAAVKRLTRGGMRIRGGTPV